MPSLSYLKRVILKEPFGWSFTDPSVHPIDNFSFEEVDLFYWHAFAEHHRALPFYIGVIYVLVIFGLQRFMRDRPAYDLQGPLFWWNLGSGIFSIVGFVRVFPGFWYVLNQPNGFYTSICSKKNGDIPGAYWTMLFILSKFWELGDTVFIVLRKRPLVFLQWYHHLITMTTVWVVAPYVEPIARWYTVLNLGVHSLMYPYFAMRVKRIKIHRFIANSITTLQLAQMIIGFTVNMLSVYWYQSGYDCVRYPFTIKVFSLVYGSFILLFGKLFYESVIKAGRAKKEKARALMELQREKAVISKNNNNEKKLETVQINTYGLRFRL